METLFPPNRKHVNVILGQGTRAGKAARAYLVSGPWNFGSVLKHSTYIHTGGNHCLCATGRILAVPTAVRLVGPHQLL